jgi:hypothetical protein
MALIDSRIRRKKVVIFFSIYIPDVNAFTPTEYNG